MLENDIPSGHIQHQNHHSIYGSVCKSNARKFIQNMKKRKQEKSARTHTNTKQIRESPIKTNQRQCVVSIEQRQRVPEKKNGKKKHRLRIMIVGAALFFSLRYFSQQATPKMSTRDNRRIL